jgi:hypothetical protein
MTDCHQPTGAEPRPLPAIHNRMPAVTGSEVVTCDIAVTCKTVATQGKSSLSPVSPLKSLPLHLRAIRVWGCRLSPVTVVTGDKPSSATVSQGVAIGLPQLSQSQTALHLGALCRFRSRPRGAQRGLSLATAAPCDRSHPAVRTETKKPKKVAHHDKP